MPIKKIKPPGPTPEQKILILRNACKFTLDLLSGLTSWDYAYGKDKPARDILAKAIEMTEEDK